MNEATNLFKRSSRSRTHSNAFGITIDAANMKVSDATNRMMQHPTAGSYPGSSSFTESSP
jgi:hypothetical protein